MIKDRNKLNGSNEAQRYNQEGVKLDHIRNDNNVKEKEK